MPRCTSRFARTSTRSSSTSPIAPNADVYLTNFFHSDSIVVTGAKPITNFSHYAAIDDLIEQARAETDPAAQAELWKQANIQILKDLAAFPLHYQNQVYARVPKVDYGHELVSSLALYPQITELTNDQRSSDGVSARGRSVCGGGAARPLPSGRDACDVSDDRRQCVRCEPPLGSPWRQRLQGEPSPGRRSLFRTVR